MTTWKQIKTAAKKEGLDVEGWEADMHARLLNDILARTQSGERYVFNPAFHDQLNMLLTLVLATIFEHDPLSEDMRHRAEDLGAAFRDEIREAGRSGRAGGP